MMHNWTAFTYNKTLLFSDFNKNVAFQKIQWQDDNCYKLISFQIDRNTSKLQSFQDISYFQAKKPRISYFVAESF